MGQNSACDDGYIGVNDGFSECDVSMGGGTGEDDGAGEDVEDDGVVKTLKMMVLVKRYV